VSIGLAAAKFFKAGLSIFSLVLSAKYFGASLDRDAWVIAGAAIAIASQLAFGPLNEIFRTRYVHLRESISEEDAIKATSSLLGAVCVISVLMIAICLSAPDQVSEVIAGGFTFQQRQSVAAMVRYLMPTLLLNELSLMWIGILNTYGSYYIPDLLSIVSVVVNILCIIVLAPLIGILSLVVSAYLSVLFLIVTLVLAIKRKQKAVLMPAIPRWKLIRPFVLYSIPFYLSYLAGNVHLFVERLLCTYLGVGTASYLDYARKFIDVPMSTIAGVVTAVLTPTLAQYFARRQQIEFAEETVRYLRMLVIIIIPVFCIFTFCSKELVEVILFHGQFKQENILPTSRILFWFGFGFMIYVFYAVSANALISSNRVIHLAVSSSITLFGSVIINLLLYRVHGAVIFPMSWSFSLLLSSMYMVTVLFGKNLHALKKICMMLCAILLTLVLSYFLKRYVVVSFSQYFISFLSGNLSVILSFTILSNIVFIGILILLRFEELRFITKGINSKNIWRNH